MKDLHSGHKNRLREKALKDINSLAEHEVLELLLNFGIIRQNTNNIAHNLINKYGSLSNVFDCSYDTLKNEPGLGEVSACLITLIPKLLERYTRSKSLKFNKIETIKDATTLFQVLTQSYDHEVLYALCLDKSNNIIALERIADGHTNEINVTTKITIKGILKHNPNKVILCHNHIINDSTPSSADMIFTKELTKILNSIDIELIEHIVVAPNNNYSYILQYIQKHDSNIL